MSQKLILVKYDLDNEIPIDESSENLMSSYAPLELIYWAVEKGFISEIMIRESSGEAADVPVSIIDDGEGNHLEHIFQHVEAELIRSIEDAHSNISEGVLIPKKLDEHFSKLHSWLEVRNILKEKKEKYKNSCNIKIVVG
ncbi:hypothetical protein [Aeromonas hydrophila]|uniref:hypothetical protein n=1 Tax=Aeromonas hydrophila TaxID=644 RepID=UPI002B47ADB2|nr:hypothetical protein [Aeromonas hydrophila]